ncbi:MULTISPECIES: amidohydrolase family protein [Peribacillus]|uniref:amidohydrolase family protein n=1 Tax=Peribacillus TaxID=2675229 RepID=UPI001F4E43DB|nr:MULTISPECIES: amidohydrolase family protein [unclassified Peribacillus]MCK1981325.1 amidohydrolase family protein [Peribacillus sp. Aquil_B1]MCK2006928.1 amidohydrolase family protein [Peribacillus sp. Aquil_B8]
MIDAHQHFWRIDRGDYSWLTNEMGVLYRDYLPDDLSPLIHKNDISGTVLVQAAPTYEETLFLLSLYDRHDWIYGVVGWLDLSAPSFPEQLDSLMTRPGIVGLRPMLQDLEDSAWILQEQVVENLKQLIRYDLPLDLLINQKHISSVLTLMKTLPNLKAVIDHLAKPNISAGELNEWQEEMNALSQLPNIWCKLSGLLTQADPARWKVDDFKPYIQHIVRAFGPERLLFGSDWPVCLSAGCYEDTVRVINGNLPETLTQAEVDGIFSGNAEAFYKLKERGERNGPVSL